MGLARSWRRALPKSCIGQLALIVFLTVSVTYYRRSVEELSQASRRQDEIPPFLKSSYRRMRKSLESPHIRTSQEESPPKRAADRENNIVIRARDMQFEIQDDSVKLKESGYKLDTLPEEEAGVVRSEASNAPSGWQRFKDDGTPKVIILAYYRSGSTLAGALFASNPKTLYAFEPLHNLYQTSIKLGERLRYYNGTIILPPSFGHEIPFVHEVLGAYLTCDFSKIDIGSLSNGLAAMSSQHLQNCMGCHRGHLKNITYLKDICVRQVQGDCSKADVRAIKEIRLSMETLDFMLEHIPSLKIIHLLRDSRGIICSQAHERSCRQNNESIQQFCAKMNIDIERRLILQKKYPGRIKLIKYENLAVNPIAVARGVYKFLKRKLPKVVEEWLYENTMSGKQSKGSMDAVRPDSVYTAYKWIKHIDWDIAKKIQNYCKGPLKHGKYPMYSSEDQLREAKIPKRPKSAMRKNV